MRNLIIAATALVLLSGCGSSRGLVRGGGPDEFAVVRAAPLVIPPDFALRPPAPGTPRPQEADSSTLALQAMFGGTAPRSAAETSAIGQAGGARAQAGIRSEAGDPGTVVVDKGSVTRDIIVAPEGPGAQASATTPK
ncbi:MAG: DUF3035 domain-containing protein [Sphingomonadaceae bacterium]